jgi:hypothetical protein
MATNSIGKGNAKIDFSIPIEHKEIIDALARESDMSTGEYVRRLISPAMSKGIVFQTRAIETKAKRKAPATVKKRNGKIA